MRTRVDSPSTTDPYAGYRTVKFRLKIIFSCLTAIPLLVFAFIYFRIGTFAPAVSGFLVALALILVLGGYIVFRKLAEHIEHLSITMTKAEAGESQRIKTHHEGTKELAVIASSFNRTLSKLRETASELGIREAQVAALHEIRDITSKSMDIEKIATVILEQGLSAVKAQGGYLALKKGDQAVLHVVASHGLKGRVPSKIGIDKEDAPLAKVALSRKSPLVVDDLEKSRHLKKVNTPDIGFPRLLYLALTVKGSSIGVLVVGRERESGSFGEQDIQFLKTLLQQVAYSVENARLYGNLLQSHKELKATMERQRRTQNQLLASTRMAAFGELTVNIAHELNNPLTGILGFTELILGSSLDGAKERELLEKIRIESLKASRITKSLLDFVSAEPRSKIKTDLNGLLRSALSLAEGRIKKGEVKIDLDLAEELPAVVVDPVQIRLVFFNLLSNALDAMSGAFNGAAESTGPEPVTSLLKVGTKAKDGKVYASFADTGPGIPPAQLERIFEPFFSTQEKVSQVGLGLSVSYGIVKAHQGSIQVKSTPGEGTHFVVILPASNGDRMSSNPTIASGK